MNHDQKPTPLEPSALFQRVFAGFTQPLSANFRLVYSLIGHLRVNHYQHPITFARLFDSFRRLVGRLLVLPGWSSKWRAMPPTPTPTPTPTCGEQEQEQEKAGAVEQQVVNGHPENSQEEEKKKIRKKALLIGIKEVREKHAETETEPCKPKRAKASKRSKGRAQQSKGKRREEGMVLNSHQDVADMRCMLQDLYGYAPGDIVTLIDDDDPEHVQPTKANIIDQIIKFVADAQDGDRFFFHYSGHSDQHDTDDAEEEDGKNEYIITCDGEEIMDDELRKLLVDPLPPSCTLFAVLDSCHSCSLLDLVHFRCNRVYVPWLNKGKRRTDTHWGMNTRKQARLSSGPKLRSSSRPAAFLTDIIVNSMRSMAAQLQAEAEAGAEVEVGVGVAALNLLHPPAGAGADAKVLNIEEIKALNIADAKTLNIKEIKTLNITDAKTLNIQEIKAASQRNLALTIHTSIPESVRFIDSPASAWGSGVGSRSQYASPVAIYCDGTCRSACSWREKDAVPRADVVCLSSSKDSQRSWEDVNGNSMTQYLIAILRKEPRRTLREVLTLVSHDIHRYYVEMHERAKDYKRIVKAENEKRVARGKEAMRCPDVEMHNFQDPQFSSHRPLDMDRLFAP